MAASEALIFNKALIHLGHGDRFLSADDENPRIGTLREVYPNLRDALIRSYQWNFATARKKLAADADVPVHGFAYRYTLPSDCLRVDAVLETYGRVWRKEGNAIVTDIPAPLKIVYARRVENPQEFDPLFVELLALDLAIAVGAVIGDKRSRRTDLKQERGELALDAKVIDANEGEEEEAPGGGWDEARF